MRFLWLQAEVAWTCIRVRKIPGPLTVADSNTRPADHRSLDFCRASKGVTEIPREIRTPVSRQHSQSGRSRHADDAPIRIPRQNERTRKLEVLVQFSAVPKHLTATRQTASIRATVSSLQPSGRGPTFSGVYGAYDVTLEISRFGPSCDSHHDVYDATSSQAATFHPHRSRRDADADATGYRHKPGERPCRRILSTSRRDICSCQWPADLWQHGGKERTVRSLTVVELDVVRGEWWINMECRESKTCQTRSELRPWWCA